MNNKAIEIELRRRKEKAAKEREAAELDREKAELWTNFYDEEDVKEIYEEIRTKLYESVLSGEAEWNNHAKFSVNIPPSRYGVLHVNPSFGYKRLASENAVCLKSALRSFAEHLKVKFDNDEMKEIGFKGLPTFRSVVFGDQYAEGREHIKEIKNKMERFYSALPFVLIFSSLFLTILTASLVFLSGFIFSIIFLFASLFFGAVFSGERLYADVAEWRAKSCFLRRAKKGYYKKDVSEYTMIVEWSVNREEAENFRKDVQKAADEALNDPCVALKYETSGVPEVDEEWEQMIAEEVSAHT